MTATGPGGTDSLEKPELIHAEPARKPFFRIFVEHKDWSIALGVFAILHYVVFFAVSSRDIPIYIILHVLWVAAMSGWAALRPIPSLRGAAFSAVAYVAILLSWMVGAGDACDEYNSAALAWAIFAGLNALAVWWVCRIRMKRVS